MSFNREAALGQVADSLPAEYADNVRDHTTEDGQPRLLIETPEQTFYVVPKTNGYKVYHPYGYPFPEIQQQADLRSAQRVAEYIESHWDKLPS